MIASLRRVGLMAVGLALISCSSEPPSAPQVQLVAPATSRLVGVVAGPTSLISLPGLRRTTPLQGNITVTQTVGRAGGTLSIPSAGVTMTIPSGALSAPRAITMTARAGALVAYEFAPHGITFVKPLALTQTLSGTSASRLSASLLQLGYYADPSILNDVGGNVSERRCGNVNLWSWTFTANIYHFSGYMMGCGREPAPE